MFMLCSTSSHPLLNSHLPSPPPSPHLRAQLPSPSPSLPCPCPFLRNTTPISSLTSALSTSRLRCPPPPASQPSQPIFMEPIPDPCLQEFLEIAHKLADAAGEILLQYFRTRFEIMDKEDQSPVTIADQAAEQAMRTIVSKHFPSHAIYGEEWGLTWPEARAEYIWVLDPIDGTKSFITGKPVFGTLIALVHKGVPVIGIIDQPFIKERWVGVKGQRTLLNGLEISTRPCSSLGDAYLYTTSPHLFNGEAEKAFVRVRNKVKVPLYGCDCYAYGLLAAGHVDLVIESGLKPYDLLALVPVVEGAGGIMTDWRGQQLQWWPSVDGTVTGCDVIAAGDAQLHQAALVMLA